jgi:hypothetical protein
MEAAENSWRSVGEILVERGLVTEADLEQAFEEESLTNRRVADILVRRGLVTGHDVTSALMEQFTRFSGSNGTDGSEDPQPAEETEPGYETVAEPEAPVAFEPEPGAWNEPPPIEDEADADTEAVGWSEPPPLPGDQPETDHEPVAWNEPAQPDEPDAVDADPPHEPFIPVQVAPYEDPPAVLASGLEELPVHPRALIREADARRLAAESKLAALGHIWQGLEQVHEDLEAHELCTLPFAHELEATQERLTAQGDALSAEIALLKQAREQIESTAQELDQLRSVLREKMHQLAELRATASMWTTRVDNQEAEVEALTTRADNAAAILSAFAATQLDAHALEDVTRQFGHADDLPPSEATSPLPAATGGGYLQLVPEGAEPIDGGDPPAADETVAGAAAWFEYSSGGAEPTSAPEVDPPAAG